jgi:biotin transport system substrate-specific component
VTPLSTVVARFPLKVSPPAELLWAFIGLLLTIGGTFLEAFMTSPPWIWREGVQVYSLGVTFQVGAVLLAGCLGGARAGLISQLAYLLLGLTWLNIFTDGGGLQYVARPTFGYLLGFVPGAWLCGYLAFKVPSRLESLAFSCLAGLAAIHTTGLTYLAIAHGFQWFNLAQTPFFQQMLTYTILPLPGQLAVVCAVTLIAVVFRNLMFY